MAWEDYDDAMKTAKELGRFHRSVERDSGNTIYMFDSEGNYLELHFPRPGGRRARQAEIDDRSRNLLHHEGHEEHEVYTRITYSEFSRPCLRKYVCGRCGSGNAALIRRTRE